MGRKASIWFRKQTGCFYVNHNAKQYNLGKDKYIAEREFHRIKAEIQPESPRNDHVTAVEVMDRYLVWTKENRAPRTFEWYERHLQAFVDGLPNQSIAADQLKPLHVNEWLSGKPWAVSTKRGAMVAIQRCFKWAVTQGYLTNSPVSSLEKPDAERRDKCPTKEEYETLRNAVRDQNFRDVLDFAWHSGARPQEIRMMEARHYQDGKIRFPVKESKGKKRVRTIYLNDEAKAIVERRLDDKYIFANRNGSPWTAYSINCRMMRLGKKTGLHFNLGSFRHGAATRWLEAGLDHVTVAALLGHTSTAMLSRHYSHIGKKESFLEDQLRKVQ